MGTGNRAMISYHSRKDSNDFHRTNLNLHRADVEYFQQKYGYGWTEKVRDIIHEYVHIQNREIDHPVRLRPR